MGLNMGTPVAVTNERIDTRSSSLRAIDDEIATARNEAGRELRTELHCFHTSSLAVVTKT
jgi:hypothetical protein